MARVSNTLIGPSSGRVGNAVFSTWKGINVLKEKPISVANPNSDGQQMRRSALAQVVTMFRQMPAAIRAGYKKLAVQMSEFNAMASEVLTNAFDYSVPPTATFVPADALISKGTIAVTPLTGQTISVGAGTVAVTYATTTPEPGQSAGDRAILCAYNITLDDWAGSATTDLRSDGAASIPLPSGWVAGNSVQVYLGFFNPSSQESSDSVTANQAIVA